MSSVIFEVVPLDAGWLLRMPGDSVAEVQPTKLEALRRARELAARYGEWRVRVLTSSGGIESELSSPEPPRTP